jgi:hypothetical protein
MVLPSVAASASETLTLLSLSATSEATPKNTKSTDKKTVRLINEELGTLAFLRTGEDPGTRPTLGRTASDKKSGRGFMKGILSMLRSCNSSLFPKIGFFRAFFFGFVAKMHKLL